MRKREGDRFICVRVIFGLALVNFVYQSNCGLEGEVMRATYGAICVEMPKIKTIEVRDLGSRTEGIMDNMTSKLPMLNDNFLGSNNDIRVSNSLVLIGASHSDVKTWTIFSDFYRTSQSGPCSDQ